MTKLKTFKDIKLARKFHEIYEEVSKKANWKTQKKCQVDFDDLPKENKETMLETATQIKDFLKHEPINWIKEIAKRQTIYLSLIRFYSKGESYDIQYLSGAIPTGDTDALNQLQAYALIQIGWIMNFFNLKETDLQ